MSVATTNPYWVNYLAIVNKAEASWGGRKPPTLRQWRVNDIGTECHITGLLRGHPEYFNGTTYTTQVEQLWVKHAIVRTTTGEYFDLGVPASPDQHKRLYALCP
jgi:hypothetical protein